MDTMAEDSRLSAIAAEYTAAMARRDEADRLERERKAAAQAAAWRELSLYDAIRNQHEEEVERLLRGADLNWRMTEDVTELFNVPRWNTFLSLSCSLASRKITKLLIRAQADVDCRKPSPLLACCTAGFSDGVSWLLAAGATCTDDVFFAACASFRNDPGHVACITALATAGEANVNVVGEVWLLRVPVFFHAFRWMPHPDAWELEVDDQGLNADGSMLLVKLLSSFGASRELPASLDVGGRYPRQAEDFVMDEDLGARPHVRDWLVRSRHWITRLHHLEVVPRQDARTLLRADHPILSSRAPQPIDGDPALSPFELAQSAAEAGEAPAGSTARLVLTYHNLRRWRNLALVAGRLIVMRIRASERAYAPGGKGYDECRTSFEGKRQRLA